MSITDFVKEKVESESNDHELIIESDSTIKNILESISVLKYGLDSKFIERDNEYLRFEFALRQVKNEIQFQGLLLKRLDKIGDYRLNDLTAKYYGITQSDVDEVIDIAKENSSLDKWYSLVDGGIMMSMSLWLMLSFPLFLAGLIIGIVGNLVIGISVFTLFKYMRKMSKAKKRNTQWATHLYDLDSRPDLNLVPENVKNMSFSEVKRLAAQKQKNEFSYPINESSTKQKQDELMNYFAFTEVFEENKASRNKGI